MSTGIVKTTLLEIALGIGLEPSSLVLIPPGGFVLMSR